MTASSEPWQDHSIHVTLFDNRYAFTLRTCKISLQNLRDLILLQQGNTKNDLPLLKLAVFGEKRSDKGSLRHNENVKSIYGVEVDYDDEKISFDEALARLKKAKLQALLYTSPSHTEAKPRWRIILPTSEELPCERRSQLVARINGLFGGQLAIESFVLSQSFYYGKIGEGKSHRAELVDGDFVDLRNDLGEVFPYPEDEDNRHITSDTLLASDPDLLDFGLRKVFANDGFKGPNDSMPYIKWNDLGMAIHAAFGGSEQGREAWEVWSKKSNKYQAAVCAERWRHWCRSPPNKAGAGKIMWAISTAVGSHGWKDVYYQEKDEVAGRVLGKLNGKAQAKDAPVREELLWVCAQNVLPRAQEWLWFGHLGRGVLELITGVPGLGKSQVQISLIACVTAELPWPDGSPPCTPRKVIMLTAEDSIDRTVVPRLIAAGANLANVFIVKMIRSDKKNRHFLLAEDLDKLEKLIQQIGGVSLMTIDPITAYMGGKVDSHKATEVRFQLNPLQEFADRTGIAISAVTHPAKNVISQRALDCFIGSQAFIAAGRIGHVCTPQYEENEDGDNVRTDIVLFTHAKHSLSKSMPTLAYSIEETRIEDDKVSGLPIYVPKVVWTGEVIDITADEAVVASNKIAAPAAKRDRDQERLQNLLIGFLRGVTKSAKECEEFAAAAGFTEKQLKTAKKKLNIQSNQKKGFWEWHLPLDEQLQAQSKNR